MDIQDRGGADLQQLFRLVQGPFRQQRVRLPLRDRQHHDVRGDFLAAARAGLHRDLPTAGGGVLEVTDPRAQQGAYPGAVEGGAAAAVVQLAERGVGPADVGGTRVGEQAGLEDHRGQRERGALRRRVERGDAHQVPQRLDGAGGLAAGGEPAAEVGAVQRRVGQVQAAQRERRPADRGALAQRQVRVAGEARGQVQRHGQPGAGEPAEAAGGGVHHRYVQPVLKGHQVAGGDPVEEPLVAGAAAQEHMLPVVHRQVAALEGEGEPAEPGAGLGEGDGQAGVGQPEGGGDAGEAAADDHGAAPRRLLRHAC